MHPTPLNVDYIRQLIEKSKVYHVDSFEICGQCHTPYGGLDGLIDYREYPAAFANWDQKKVAETQEMMAQILELSHAAGKKVKRHDIRNTPFRQVPKYAPARRDLQKKPCLPRRCGLPGLHSQAKSGYTPQRPASRRRRRQHGSLHSL